MVIIETALIVEPAWSCKEFDEIRYKKLVSCIKRYGQLRTITVRNNQSKGGEGFLYEVLEGRNILLACKEAEIPFVWANNLGDVDDLTAMEISLCINELEFLTDFVDVASLVKKIVSETSVRNAANLSMFDQREITKYLKIFDFDWEGFNRAKLSGQISLFEEQIKHEENGVEEEESTSDNEQLEQSNSELPFA